MKTKPLRRPLFLDSAAALLLALFLWRSATETVFLAIRLETQPQPN